MVNKALLLLTIPPMDEGFVPSPTICCCCRLFKAFVVIAAAIEAGVTIPPLAKATAMVFTEPAPDPDAPAAAAAATAATAAAVAPWTPTEVAMLVLFIYKKKVGTKVRT